MNTSRRPHIIDLEDFWAPEAILALMEATGFAAVTVKREHLRFEQNLRVWLDTVRRRETNSQLMAMSDRGYRKGIERLEAELADEDAPKVRADHLCLTTIRGQRRADIA